MNLNTHIFRASLSGGFSFLFGNWKKWLFSVWLLAALSIWFFSDDPLIVFSGYGVLIAGISTVIFWHYRIPLERRVKKIGFSAGQKFVVIGALAAAWVEFEFWSMEIISGVRGIAANPNFFLDLLATMPWYIIMTFLLWKVLTKYSYSLYAILIYGGIYDFFADGILGTIINTGSFPSAQQFISLLINFPVFVITYSFIVLVPVGLLREEIVKAEQDKGIAKYIYGLLPLLGLIPYGIVLLSALFRSGQ